jgi:predicted nucleotide-binding protein
LHAEYFSDEPEPFSGSSTKNEQNSSIKEDFPISKKIFIVHGHNQAIKESVARFIEKLNLEAIILHEKPDMGRTLIEKFSDYSDVSFAIVLLTSDDMGGEKDGQGNQNPRARQNVIFELGFFIGKLGRSKVCALYEAGVEIPSDYKGTLYKEIDKNGAWKYEIIKELKEAGFKVDANVAFG